MMTEPETSKNNPKVGITAISVRGFKSLAQESRIELRPLTVLAGANSSGKSSIMQPLLLMKQTLQANYDPGPLLLDGPNAKFASAEQFISYSQRKLDSQEFSVEIESGRRRTIKTTYSPDKHSRLRVQDMTISIIRGPEEETHTLRLTPNQNTDELMDAVLHFAPEKGLPDLPPGWRWVVLENRCFLDVYDCGRRRQLSFHKSL